MKAEKKVSHGKKFAREDLKSYHAKRRGKIFAARVRKSLKSPTMEKFFHEKIDKRRLAGSGGGVLLQGRYFVTLK